MGTRREKCQFVTETGVHQFDTLLPGIATKTDLAETKTAIATAQGGVVKWLSGIVVATVSKSRRGAGLFDTPVQAGAQCGVPAHRRDCGGRDDTGYFSDRIHLTSAFTSSSFTVALGGIGTWPHTPTLPFFTFSAR
jgi:hypothetical protein